MPTKNCKLNYQHALRSLEQGPTMQTSSVAMHTSARTPLWHPCSAAPPNVAQRSGAAGGGQHARAAQYLHATQRVVQPARTSPQQHIAAAQPTVGGMPTHRPGSSSAQAATASTTPAGLCATHRTSRRHAFHRGSGGVQGHASPRVSLHASQALLLLLQQQHPASTSRLLGSL